MKASIITVLLVALLLAALLLPSPVSGQSEMSGSDPRGTRIQLFYFDALNFATSDEFGRNGQLDLYVHVPYDLVTFIKKDEFYVGSYTITALFSYVESDRILLEENWESSIRQLGFDRTNNPNYYDLTQRSFNLDPGTYLLEVIFEDKESRLEFRLSKRIQMRSFDKNVFQMSDLMLVRDSENKNGKKQISPQINPSVSGLRDGFDLFYELYNPYNLGAVSITYTISLRGEVVCERKEVQAVKRGRSTFLAHIETKDFLIGSYSLRVTVNRPDDSTAAGALAIGERGFMMEWLSAGSPVSIMDLDDAIDQLQYFANGDDLDYMQDAENESEKRERFNEFWERHNPAPGTEINTLMIEYYNRVAYANKSFKHYLDGWRTDRGMVYIIYGAPDYVDRYPLDTESKPYEIWEYYNVNKRFTFIDESGFDDYRLLYPIWDDRNRLR